MHKIFAVRHRYEVSFASMQATGRKPADFSCLRVWKSPEAKVTSGKPNKKNNPNKNNHPNQATKCGYGANIVVRSVRQKWQHTCWVAQWNIFCLQTRRVRPWLRHSSRNVKTIPFISNVHVATFRNDILSTLKSMFHHVFQKPYHSIRLCKQITQFVLNQIWKSCTSGLRAPFDATKALHWHGGTKMRNSLLWKNIFVHFGFFWTKAPNIQSFHSNP